MQYYVFQDTFFRSHCSWLIDILFDTGTYKRGRYYEEGYGPISSSFSCQRDDDYLYNCTRNLCNRYQHIEIDCEGTCTIIYHCCSYSIHTVPCVDGTARLSGSSLVNQGRVEVCINNTWETICGNLDANDKMIVCQQLGFSSAGYSHAAIAMLYYIGAIVC